MTSMVSSCRSGRNSWYFDGPWRLQLSWRCPFIFDILSFCRHCPITNTTSDLKQLRTRLKRSYSATRTPSRRAWGKAIACHGESRWGGDCGHTWELGQSLYRAFSGDYHWYLKKQKQNKNKNHCLVDREIQKEWSAENHIWVSLLASRALGNPWNLSSSMGQWLYCTLWTVSLDQTPRWLGTEHARGPPGTRTPGSRKLPSGEVVFVKMLGPYFPITCTPDLFYLSS